MGGRSQFYSVPARHDSEVTRPVFQTAKTSERENGSVSDWSDQQVSDGFDLASKTNGHGTIVRKPGDNLGGLKRWAEWSGSFVPRWDCIEFTFESLFVHFKYRRTIPRPMK